MGAAKIILRGALLVLLAGDALAQQYECRSPTDPRQIILQHGVPCAPGMDARVSPAQEREWLRQQELERKRAEAANEKSAAVMRGEIRIGMTTSQVLQSWGHPMRTKLSESERSKHETWIWRCATRREYFNYVYFRNGAVSRIERSC